MVPQSIMNIVLSCENEDAHSLIRSVDEALTEKVIVAYDLKKREIGNSLLEGKKLLLEPEKNKDPYEECEPKVKEAIDYTVESVLENNLELENTIQMAATQFGISEESLREYFDQLLEVTRTEIRVDSTKSNDEDEKRGTRDDEDVNKRVRYESVLVLNDGAKITLSETMVHNIDTVVKSLNEDNLKSFIGILTSDKKHCLQAIDFCQKMVNG